MAKKKGIEEPLFKEKAYKEYLNFRLSTSQLPSREDILIGYGPVVSPALSPLKGFLLSRHRHH